MAAVSLGSFTGVLVPWGVNIAYVSRLQLAVFERHANGPRCAFAARGNAGHMVGITAHAIAHHFSVNARPSAEGMF